MSRHQGRKPSADAARGMVVLAKRGLTPQQQRAPRTPLEQFLRALETGYGEGENGWLR